MPRLLRSPLSSSPNALSTPLYQKAVLLALAASCCLLLRPPSLQSLRVFHPSKEFQCSNLNALRQIVTVKTRRKADFTLDYRTFHNRKRVRSNISVRLTLNFTIFYSSNRLMICRTWVRVSFTFPFSNAFRVASARIRGILNKYEKASRGTNFAFSLASFNLLCV